MEISALSQDAQPATGSLQEPVAVGLSASRPRLGKLGLLTFAALLLVTAFLGDALVDQYARGHRSVAWDHVALAISKYGEWYFLLAVSMLALICGWLCRHRLSVKVAIALILSSCVAGITATTIRWVTGRTRPSADVAQGWYGIRHGTQWLIGKAEFNSFPSGHMGFAAGFATVLFLSTRRGRFLAVVLAASMAWARIYLGCHHLSDVVVAAMIGVAVGVYAWYRLIPRLLGG